jgi:hypothetical protein
MPEASDLERFNTSHGSGLECGAVVKLCLSSDLLLQSQNKPPSPRLEPANAAGRLQEHDSLRLMSKLSKAYQL